MKTNLGIGIYEAQARVQIRREPRITGTNVTGAIDTGTQKYIYSIQTDAKSYTWGRISEPDSAGISLWVCIQIPNRTFMKFVQAGDDHPTGDATLESRVTALEAWARAKGYAG